MPIHYDAVQMAYLSGNIAAAATAVASMNTNKSWASEADWGDDAMPVALARFSKTWNFRRKYLVKEMRMLVKALDNFTKDISDAEGSARDFLKRVKARAEGGPIENLKLM